MESNEPIWSPSEEQIKDANLTKYLIYLKTKFKLKFINYAQLYEWSINNREDFWSTIWSFCKVVYSKPYETVLKNADDMLESKWFIGAKFNFAENLLRYKDSRSAIIFKNEKVNSEPKIITYKKLYNEVARLAKALREQGIKVGDRVAGLMPNMIETVIAMLATLSIGAIWSSCSPDFGTRAVIDRFKQIEPRILFIADGYFYNGKAIDSITKTSEVLKELTSVEKVIIVSYINQEFDITKLPNSVKYQDFLSKEKNLKLKFEQLPFNHPIYILYSSGTTGAPKCIVHNAGGTLLQHLKELVLHTNLKREDRIFYFTTCGWMMWNWLVSALAAGSTLILFDGSPFYPSAEALFKLVDELRITIFGTNARYIESVEKLGLKPKEKFNLSSLKSILSTGSPLSAESFKFIYRDVKNDVLLASISGGTDIISCFALGCPITPVWSGELQCFGLGMKCDVFDEKGKSIRGKKGELVCTASFPSQPIYFWKDADKGKYREAYFNMYQNVWRHGDYAEVTEHGGIIIHGRSDATLNPYGIRIGTAEIYQQVGSIEGIADSIAIGQNWENNVRIVLFIKLLPEIEFNDELVKKIKTTIRNNCTPNHVPAKIIPVKDIPYTMNGKKVELAVKKIIEHEPVTNLQALKNPEALEFYKNLSELKE